MIFSIKQLSSNPALSEETLAFTCSVYIDGKKVFTAMNNGTGGCHSYHPVKGKTYKEIREAEAWARSEHPDEFEPLDFVIDGLVERESARKILAREFKKKVLFKTPDGKLMEYRYFSKEVDEAKIKEGFAHAGNTVLNDLPIEEAVTVYLEAQQ